ncbi:MAG: hypothetical protein CVU56_27830 [Deltaproteobacteria bacterium HGW-Deltaproteobacteria-14]|jgi:hypothetical protein|nr:MAG: hypothetical protein CVU56_27830 [Deltaproteobacteria bacterium HGW-Deltaproteobacteria-14]
MAAAATWRRLLLAAALLPWLPLAARADDSYNDPSGDEDRQDGPNRTYCPPEDCSWCALLGRCFHEADTRCGIGKVACRDSQACWLHGRCDEGTSAVDGRPPRKRFGACEQDEGRCVTGAPPPPPCAPEDLVAVPISKVTAADQLIPARALEPPE